MTEKEEELKPMPILDKKQLARAEKQLKIFNWIREELKDKNVTRNMLLARMNTFLFPYHEKRHNRELLSDLIEIGFLKIESPRNIILVTSSMQNFVLLQIENIKQYYGEK